MPVLVVFIDGIGLGDADPHSNPFVRVAMPALQLMSGGPPGVRFAGPRPTAGGVALALDARLGVPGLPQSATGQTAMLTGINAPALLGRHLSAYPTPLLLRLLQADNMFLRTIRHGGRAVFLNSFNRSYIRLVTGLDKIPYSRVQSTDAGDPPPRGRRARRVRPSATTAAALAAGLRLQDEEDLAAGRALYHDVTGRWLDIWYRSARPGPINPPAVIRSPRDAAAVAVRALANHDLVFFEHFLTDLVGHRRLDLAPEELLLVLDAFLDALLDLLPADALLLVTSDHGNLEDMTTRTHTYNPVPLLAWGRDARRAAASAASVADVFTVVGRALGWS